jgi:hypothetical protein
MTGDETVGFIATAEMMEKYFLRVIEAEKKLGPLSREEKIVILKSLASPITLDELTDTIAGKRILVIKDKNEKHD